MGDADRERWDARYREQGPCAAAPSALVTALDDLLPRRGRALDVAGGAGRHAVWLARRGLDVTLVDVSPVGVDLARAAAAAAGVALDAFALDLERDPLPGGPWDVIVDFHYLQRDLFPAFARLLAPGGVLVFVQPTRTNLERHPRPGPAHLLDDGEAARLAAGLPLEVLRLDEGWLAEGRHEARLVARRA
ncbi:MAG: class I SAM-dependent methyltransferase [Planctomycetes bacterium]|nr:class I SAM-dependent methyltransferase [Planctomycetota bacterium]